MPLDVQRIERLRIKAGLTQAEVAAKIGLSRQRWNNVVKGRSANISVKTLDRLAEALGTESTELLLPRKRQ
jgi:transcriptional regulator with XRE-family HTH domain